MENTHAPFNPLGIKCPYCPICGAEPILATINVSPWFCPNEDCNCLAWDPYIPAVQSVASRYKLDLIDENSDDLDI
jgi:hypothetical protein